MSAMLILRLDGVLQSWGLRSRWDVRDTNFVPSKSGVIGIISCAMGIPRGDERIIWLDRNLCMGVRADRAGTILEDYHTVTGERGYLLCAKGDKRVGTATIITPRKYLQDACFTVILQGERSLLEKCAEALQNPVWLIYLGRKSCPPSRPVFEALSDDYESLEQAIREYPLCSRHGEGGRFYCEIEDPDGDIVRYDSIRKSGCKYGIRRSKWIFIEH